MKRVKLTLVTAVVFALVCAVSFAASSIDWSEANEEGLAQFVFEVIESDQAELENGEVSADMYSILYERSAIEALKDSEHYIADNDPANVVSQEVEIKTGYTNVKSEAVGAEIEDVSFSSELAQNTHQSVSTERVPADAPEVISSVDSNVEVYTVQQILAEVLSFQDEIQISHASVSASSNEALKSSFVQSSNPESGSVNSGLVDTESNELSVAASEAVTGEWSAIPEPTTALFGIFGVVALAVARRRMKSRE